MDTQLEQWFQDAAGFSAVDLSMFIRTFAFCILMLFCGYVLKGLLTEIVDNPLSLFQKIIFLLIFVSAMWAVLYV